MAIRQHLRPAVDAASLLERYECVRGLTERLAEPLSPEDQVVQSMPDASPTKWHRAHTTWFFETFVLCSEAARHIGGYDVADHAYRYLFNSYYEAVGDRHPRPERGLITRPDCREVGEYRCHVDEAMLRLIASCDGHPEILRLVELGLNHEQQHQELVLMDIKHALSRNPTHPAYGPSSSAPPFAVTAPEWIAVDGGLVQIGHDGDDFAFDNETPRHTQVVEPYRLADRLVTCGEWQEFIDEGSYDDPRLWLSDGWATVNDGNWEAPLYWERVDREWGQHTLGGYRPVEPAEPVSHVSYYEADAFARWAGARLPTEAEWEVAAASRSVEGNLLASGALHPRPVVPTGDDLHQLFGDVWEWTSSPYSPYPGFRPEPGAVGEYNGKFMVNQMVLRGGCCLTPDDHIRDSYRNFFPPASRWMVGGLRLASDD